MTVEIREALYFQLVHVFNVYGLRNSGVEFVVVMWVFSMICLFVQKEWSSMITCVCNTMKSIATFYKQKEHFAPRGKTKIWCFKPNILSNKLIIYTGLISVHEGFKHAYM